MAGFDVNSVKGNDRFIAGGAIALFVVSLFHWYTISSSGKVSATRTVHASKSYTAWGDVSYGWAKIGILLALVAGAIVIARLMGALDSINLPAGVNLITFAVSALATLLLLLRFLTSFKTFSDSGVFGGLASSYKVTGHPGIGWYLGLAISAAMSYFAFLNFKASGEELPTKPGGTQPSAPDAP